MLRTLAIVLLSGISFFAVPAASQPVTVSFGGNGVSSLRFNGTEFLAYGDIRLGNLKFQTAVGQIINGDLANGVVTVDAAARRVVRNSSWGSLTVDYTPGNARLDVLVTVQNRTANTLQGIWFEPFGLRFPGRVTEYDGNIPLLVNSVSGPALVRMSYGSGVMALVHENPAKAIQIGFPWAFDKPLNTTFPLSVNTDRVSPYPDSYPVIKRPIPAGGSDQYRFSLRFGGPGATLDTLAADAYQAFAAAYPMRLQWTDRRPIGALFLSTAATGWPTNPRGWMFDPTVDVTNAAGIARLRERTLAYADSSIAILRAMNAQGMITWDIEGQEYPHAISFIGDPRIFSTLAPEMAGIADDYFRRFRDAGLRVGVCIRPQQLQVSADRRTAFQVPQPDPTQLLIDKVAYARNRWGATIFYVDSNVTSDTDSSPTDAAVFRRLAETFPDVLFVPEHANLLYYAYSAPYDELRQGITSTSSDVRRIYPQAYTVIYTADGPIDARFNDLVSSVRGGDGLLFRGWFDDPQNAKVKAIYEQAGIGSPPGAPPTVNFVSPVNGGTVSNTITAAAVAYGSNPIAGIRFQLDGSNMGTEDTIAPYSIPLDTKTLSNGIHSLTAIARDSRGLTASAQISVTVANSTAAPTVSFSSPTNGATVSGSVALAAITTGGSPISGVQFKVDGANIGGEDTTAPYTASFDSTAVANGNRVLSAVVRDSDGRTASANITVNVSNPTGAPIVTILSPADGSTVSNTITLVADAIGGKSFIIAAHFRVDGNSLGGEDSSPPYTRAIDTKQLSDGPHTLTAVARDADGRLGLASIIVNVNNSSATPLTVAFSSPANGSTVSNTVTLSAVASGGSPIAGVQFKLDGANIGGEDATAPYSASLNTVPISNGNHTLTAVARDSQGRTAIANVTVTVSNTTAAPTVVFSSPANGSTVSNTVTLSAIASGGAPIVGVQFKLDGANIGGEDATAPYSASLNTVPISNGNHTLTAVARDSQGRTALANIAIQVSNPVVAAGCTGMGSGNFFGCYYSGRNLKELKFTRIDNAIDFNWGYSVLGPGVGPEQFSVRWQGQFQFEDGDYLFTAATDDGQRLYIDDQIVLNQWYEHSAIPFEVKHRMTPGVHTIRLEYFQSGGKAAAKLDWVKK